MASKQAIKTGGSEPQENKTEKGDTSPDEDVAGTGTPSTSGKDNESYVENIEQSKSIDARMGELDKVRNILFGEQIRLYEERMQHMEDGLKTDLATLRSDLKAQIKDMDDRFKVQFDEMFELMGKETHSRENQDEAIARDLSQLTETFEDFRISQGKKLEALDGSLLATLESRTHNLESDLREKIDALSAELKTALDRLEMSAVHRARFADLLSGLAREISPNGKDDA